MTNSRQYWMRYDGPELASKLCSYHENYFGRNVNPIYQMWLRNSYAYYSTILDAQTWISSLRFEGEQGELIKMSIPQSRSLIRQLLTLVTKQKLAFNAIAQVQGSDVTEAVRIANALCEQIVTKQTLDVKAEQMVEQGLVMGTGFLKGTWRSDLGTARAVVPRSGPTGGDGGNAESDVIYDGDFEVTTPHLLDMMYDFTIQDWEQLDWAECRVKRSRWTLIAQHPELEEEILNLPSVSQDLRMKANIFGVEDQDMVSVYEMYHKPTPSLPRGRMLIYSNSKTIYYDDENPYECIPIVQYKPEPIDGLGFGYPMLANLLPAQEMYDVDLSSIATNHSSLGVQNVAIPRDSGINVQHIYGMNFIAYTPQDVPGGGKPEPLQLVQSSPELFKLPEVLLANMQQMSNINAAVRGELPGSTSGVAIATLTTNALEFLSSYSKCLNISLEKLMYIGIQAYRKFARVDRLISITGRNYQAFTKTYTGKVLEPIQAIKIQATNPLLMTMAGRLEVADKSMQAGMVKSMQDYAAILDGQPLTKLFETELSQTDLIQAENEMLSEGEMPLTVSIDDHPTHIFKHRVLLNDPRIRRDSQRVKLILDHIAEHDRLAMTTSPVLQAMANTGRMPEGAFQQQQQAPPPGPDGNVAPQDEPGQIPEQSAGPGGDPGESMKDPSMPTAEPAQPADDLLGRSA